MVNNKKKGSFFTPEKLSRYICGNLLANIGRHHGKLNVLEPSVGHGSFVKALNGISEEGNLDIHVDAYDNDIEFIDHCQASLFSNISTSFLCTDFIDVEESSKKYDIVVGNPPYVSYKILDHDCSSRCRDYFEKKGVESKNFRNLWTFFVLKSINCLSDEGSLHLIVPKELLYVNHAGWLRSLLIKTFQQINLHIFDHFQFDGIEQDVVVIECYKSSSNKGFFVCENETNLTGKPRLQQKIIDQGISNKWSQISVSEDDLAFLHKTIDMLPLISDCCVAVAGIVTAANKFFILDKEKINSFGENNISRPIIQKSSCIQGDVVLDKTAFQKIEGNGVSCHLLCDFNMPDPPPLIAKHLKEGELMGLTNRYKMKKRTPWYKIPVIWESPAFFFKRIHEIPKLILNEANVLVTDTAYRVTPLEGVDMQSVIYSFYNSLTLVFCELRGRSYGGGVLELTPNEFKGIPIPYQRIDNEAFARFRKKFTTMSFDELLAHQDKEILTKLGLLQPEIENIQGIRKSLITKRLKGN
ncbi:MAG: SAM-dependent methyltransferase [Proteobacteria bacterium]|nr:SAM-dependent methyltransferase [Pseudomonadota bacterium]MBU1648012.1 SAM-dependent methyltransferase [Pseudomonadota bacterium]